MTFRQGPVLIEICPVKVVAFRWEKVLRGLECHMEVVLLRRRDSDSNLSDEPS